jgi:tRNA pseudouridine32 synthase/23S rRNA pseudouridine746 synthase
LYAPPAIAALSSRLLLHACTLALAHPITHAPLQFHCPADMELAPK